MTYSVVNHRKSPYICIGSFFEIMYSVSETLRGFMVNLITQFGATRFSLGLGFVF